METGRKQNTTEPQDTEPGQSEKIYSKNFRVRWKVNHQRGVGGGLLVAQTAIGRGQGLGCTTRAPDPPGAPLRLLFGLEFLLFSKNY